MTVMMDAKAVMNANMNATMNAKSEVLAKSEYDIQEYQILTIIKKLVLLVEVSIAAISFARIEARPPKTKMHKHKPAHHSLTSFTTTTKIKFTTITIIYH
jgi:hypothetical protein